MIRAHYFSCFILAPITDPISIPLLYFLINTMHYLINKIIWTKLKIFLKKKSIQTKTFTFKLKKDMVSVSKAINTFSFFLYTPGS